MIWSKGILLNDQRLEIVEISMLEGNKTQQIWYQSYV